MAVPTLKLVVDVKWEWQKQWQADRTVPVR
jgi:hypothetical protein